MPGTVFDEGMQMYRQLNAAEARSEVDRLQAENERLRSEVHRLHITELMQSARERIRIPETEDCPRCAVLSTSVEPESSGDDPEVARHEEILKEAWRFWASIQGDPVALDRGYRILRVHPDRYAAFDALFRPGARPMDQPAATPHDDARE
jgi:hypothetical protein